MPIRFRHWLPGGSTRGNPLRTRSYLTDAHAIEAQALQLLETGSDIAGFEELAAVFRDHLDETREQQRLVRERLRNHDARLSAFRTQRCGSAGSTPARSLGRSPTPAKLARFAFAFEHLEIAAYELLRQVAGRAGDLETVSVASKILEEEQRAAERIAETWDAALDAACEPWRGERPGLGIPVTRR